ncbi:MAG: histidine triad nucleotide-binding protein [Spirochaetota bacterium]
MSEETIFEKILRGEIPSEKVYEDESVYAFRDIDPQAPVHVLVIPRTKLESFADLPDADTGDVAAFMQGVAKTARELGLEENGYRVVFNTGPDALQSVQYLHAHIIGGRKLSWPPG